MAITIYCEGCGEEGGRHEDPYYPGDEDGLIDICAPCLRHRRRQAKIDAQALRDDEAYRAEGDREMALAG
ncbi:hypothetical protein MED01_004288 [Micromonospora sp. MED01]|uniref:hypothetical protein n=1 Tax=Micromonospora alfalfae TaxID=2911212 RepID=UPI001EE86D17|nr:hypothetical protein [Micromonospora alfalfae]MCG5460862.1 hypothetical protein [Micromonospora alfalfae]